MIREKERPALRIASSSGPAVYAACLSCHGSGIAYWYPFGGDQEQVCHCSACQGEGGQSYEGQEALDAILDEVKYLISEGDEYAAGKLAREYAGLFEALDDQREVA